MSRKRTRTAILLYVALLCILYALPISANDMGIYAGAPWYNWLTYQHFHGSIFHLLCNCWALLVFAFTVRTPWYKFIIAYALSATYPLVGEDVIVGVSGLIYAVAGMYSFYGDTIRKFSQYHLFFIATIAFGALFSHVAVGIHAYCYFLGAVYAFFFIPIRTPLHRITSKTITSC